MAISLYRWQGALIHHSNNIPSFAQQSKARIQCQHRITIHSYCLNCQPSCNMITTVLPKQKIQMDRHSEEYILDRVVPGCLLAQMNCQKVWMDKSKLWPVLKFLVKTRITCQISLKDFHGRMLRFWHSPFLRSLTWVTEMRGFGKMSIWFLLVSWPKLGKVSCARCKKLVT